MAGAENDSRKTVAKMVEQMPGLAAAVSKLTRGEDIVAGHDGQGNKLLTNITGQLFSKQHAWRSKKNFDAKVILRLLPDLDLARLILVSSILSPADMQKQVLTLGGSDDLVSSNLKTALLTRIHQYLDETYRISADLSKILSHCLFEKGSYPVVVLPENAIDEMINGPGQARVSTESMRLAFNRIHQYEGSTAWAKPAGILGKAVNLDHRSGASTPGFSFESFAGSRPAPMELRDTYLHLIGGPAVELDEHVRITDNVNVLRLPKLKERSHSTLVRAAMEAASDLQIERKIMGRRQPHQRTMLVFKNQADLLRKSVGVPLVMHLPSESVIPVHVPGKAEDHVGYFVLLDMEGHPISAEQMANDSMSGLNTNSAPSNSTGSNLLQRVGVAYGLGSMSGGGDAQSERVMSQIYGELVVRDLTARIRNGVQGQDVTVAQTEEIYRVMLARSMRGMYSQLLYVPKEYMSYIAFDYDEFGMGKSLLDDLGVICTLRIVTMFANAMSNVRNAIGRTNVKVALDPKDPDPSKTLEIVKHDIVRSRYLNLPDSHDPADIMGFLSSAGYEFHVSDHPRVSKLDFEISEGNTTRATVDSDFTDYLRKLSNMGLFLSPESIDSGLGNQEFATSLVQNNMLLGKRVMTFQDIFTPQLADYLKKILLNNMVIRDELVGMIVENFEGVKLQLDDEKCFGLQGMDEAGKQRLIAEEVCDLFINTMTTSLPSPASNDVETQNGEFVKMVDLYDKMLDEAILPNDAFETDMVGEIGGKKNQIKAMAKSLFLRRWMSEKGVGTELLELVTANDAGDPQVRLLDETVSHMRSLIKAMTKASTQIKPMADAADRDLQATGQDGDGASSSGSSDYGSSGDEDSGGGDDDFGGGDEFGDLGSSDGIMDPEGGEEEPDAEPTA